LVPNKYRAVGLVWTEIMLGVPNIFCSLIAHALQQNTVLGWRWLFIISIIIISVALIGTFFTYFPPSHPQSELVSRWSLTKQIDFFGLFLFTGGIVVFLVAITWGGTQFPWNSAACIAPIVIGIVLTVASFVWGFSGIPKDPLFSLPLFKKWREFTCLLLIGLVAGFVFVGSSALIPQQLQFIYTYDAITIGVYQLAGGFGTAIGGIIWPLFIHKIKHVHLQIIVACAMQLLFFGLMALDTPDTLGMALAFQLLAYIPFGFIVIAGYTTISLHIPQKELGLATGLFGTFRCVGFSLGSSLLVTIFNTTSGSAVGPDIIAAVTPLGLQNAAAAIPDFIAAFESGELSLLNTIPGMTPAIAAAAQAAFKAAFNHGFFLSWIAIIPFNAAALILSFFVLDCSKYMTHHIAVRMEKEVLNRSKETDIKE
jgi:hypothetical protein